MPLCHGPRLVTYVLGALFYIVASGILASPSPARADDVQDQFWPELDVYYKVAEPARLHFIATYTLTEGDAPDNQQYGINLDLNPKVTPLASYLRGAGALADNRVQPVQLRIGYRHSDDFNTPTPSIQDRIIVEFTGRIPARAYTLSDRNGIDFRWTDGEYSSRYRNRIALEVSANLKQYAFTPFADAEWFYSITDGYWTSVKYEAGMELPLVNRVSVIPNLGWQTYWHSTAPTTPGVGINLALSW